MSAAGPAVIDAAEAIVLVSAGNAWLLDVREDHEWQAGHAPGAHHLPMGELGQRQDELPAGQTILVICHSGARSRAVTDALRAAEYPALNVEGGMVAWNSAGGEVVKPDAFHQR
ncbi:rhodanese-like domain-containing protein [Glaciibacter sp. 2TAF33]|uniref:rhodanese-like domain-containing protein n=1 Tax=Glaciibacter sp. 2TAF33 TaxID=3233015 RepID=UPI003F901A5D